MDASWLCASMGLEIPMFPDEIHLFLVHHKPGRRPSSEDLLFKLLILGLLWIFIFHAMRDTGEKGKNMGIYKEKHLSLSLSLFLYIYIYFFANLRHIQYLTYMFMYAPSMMHLHTFTLPLECFWCK